MCGGARQNDVEDGTRMVKSMTGYGRAQQMPVSDTHLDVYKRQTFGMEGTPVRIVVRERDDGKK